GCTAVGGVFFLGQNCSPGPCAGACCDPATGSCLVRTPAQCTGNFRPGVCDPNPCPRGTCCNPSNGGCTITGSQGTCINTFTPGNATTTCTPNPCPAPCCSAIGVCTIVAQSSCTGVITTGFIGACMPNPCPAVCCSAT